MTRRGLAAAAARHDTREHLGAVRHPTLILTGSADVIIAPAVQEELAAALHGATHHTIDGAGHDLTIERPEATADEVRRFVRAARG